MLAKFILWVTALSFCIYGLVCFFAPEIPTGYIGFVLTTADSAIEMVAMYGGLEIGVGLFCLLGAVNPHYTKAGLLLVILVVGGLAIGRLYSFILNSEPVSVYTYGALCYEWATTLIAALAYYNTRQAKGLGAY